MKLVSWNVNGIRAIAQKNFFNDIRLIAPDILCIQETKAQDDHIAAIFSQTGGFHIYSNSADKPGYSGTAIISRFEPMAWTKGISIREHDTEGRVICLEFEKYYLVNVYVPNSGAELKRLKYRQTWDDAFFDYLKNLEKTKPVVVCGDFNVAHRDIDLARPKDNYNKTAGYMQEEIDGMNMFSSGGFADTFRLLYPNAAGRYSWWSYRAGARPKNIGWRIDYFLVSESILKSVVDAFILDEIGGSDHCPVGIDLAL
jgi:exodeoxyribonuclease-3